MACVSQGAKVQFSPQKILLPIGWLRYAKIAVCIKRSFSPHSLSVLAVRRLFQISIHWISFESYHMTLIFYFFFLYLFRIKFLSIQVHRITQWLPIILCIVSSYEDSQFFDQASWFKLMTKNYIWESLINPNVNLCLYEHDPTQQRGEYSISIII